MYKDSLKYPIYLSSTIGFLISAVIVYTAIQHIQHLLESDGWRKLSLLIVAFVFCAFAIINIIVITRWVNYLC